MQIRTSLQVLALQREGDSVSCIVLRLTLSFCANAFGIPITDCFIIMSNPRLRSENREQHSLRILCTRSMVHTWWWLPLLVEMMDCVLQVYLSSLLIFFVISKYFMPWTYSLKKFYLAFTGDTECIRLHWRVASLCTHVFLRLLWERTVDLCLTSDCNLTGFREIKAGCTGPHGPCSPVLPASPFLAI